MTTRMLQGSYLSVMQAHSPDEFREELVRFAHRLGFDLVSAMTVIDHPCQPSDFISVNNVPTGFTEAFNDPSQQRRDPVMQHCKKAAVPIVWDRDTYVSRGMEDVWEAQAAFGYRTGICMALHLPQGRHFMLGVEREQQLPEAPDLLTRLVADLQLFAVHAQDAAFRLMAPAPETLNLPALTPRELEALRWTMDGKTAWEVGNIMSISERTAVLHLQNAMRKLDCVNKHQAVLKALRLGLLH